LTVLTSLARAFQTWLGLRKGGKRKNGEWNDARGSVRDDGRNGETLKGGRKNTKEGKFRKHYL